MKCGLLALAMLAAYGSADAQFIFSVPVAVKVEQSADRPTLYGEVNQQSAARVIGAIHTANKNEAKTPIYLYLQSPGGSVMAGDAVISAMAVSRRPVVTVVVGGCASMCAMIAEHGIARVVLPHGYIMFHNASVELSGELPHVASQLSLILRTWESNEQFVAKRAGIKLDEFRMHEAMQWWLTPADALQSHLVDAVANLTDYPAPTE